MGRFPILPQSQTLPMRPLPLWLYVSLFRWECRPFCGLSLGTFRLHSAMEHLNLSLTTCEVFDRLPGILTRQILAILPGNVADHQFEYSPLSSLLPLVDHVNLFFRRWVLGRFQEGNMKNCMLLHTFILLGNFNL
jgi:hypothetical protein